MIDNLAQGVHAFTSNVFYVGGDRPVVVDPGANFDVLDRLETRPDPEAVIVTHTHPDHVGNLEAIKEAYGIDAWGFDTTQDGIDHALSDEDHVRLGDHEYLALHTPGHAPDHLCLYAETPGVLFAGDLVFQNGAFGRTDLEEGHRPTLIDSIDRVLEYIDEDLAEMHTGHGPSIMNEPYSHVELSSRMARQA